MLCACQRSRSTGQQRVLDGCAKTACMQCPLPHVTFSNKPDARGPAWLDLASHRIHAPDGPPRRMRWGQLHLTGRALRRSDGDQPRAIDGMDDRPRVRRRGSCGACDRSHAPGIFRRREEGSGRWFVAGRHQALDEHLSSTRTNPRPAFRPVVAPPAPASNTRNRSARRPPPAGRRRPPSAASPAAVPRRGRGSGCRRCGR